MSGGLACRCPGTNEERKVNWRVLDHKCNYSKFNGSRYTPSAYSSVTCRVCGSVWRTKAAYVDQLPFGDLMGFAINGKA
jgi:hypothetical protein